MGQGSGPAQRLSFAERLEIQHRVRADAAPLQGRQATASTYSLPIRLLGKALKRACLDRPSIVGASVRVARSCSQRRCIARSGESRIRIRRITARDKYPQGGVLSLQPGSFGASLPRPEPGIQPSDAFFVKQIESLFFQSMPDSHRICGWCKAGDDFGVDQNEKLPAIFQHPKDRSSDSIRIGTVKCAETDARVKGF